MRRVDELTSAVETLKREDREQRDALEAKTAACEKELHLRGCQLGELRDDYAALKQKYDLLEQQAAATPAVSDAEVQELKHAIKRKDAQLRDLNSQMNMWNMKLRQAQSNSSSRRSSIEGKQKQRRGGLGSTPQPKQHGNPMTSATSPKDHYRRTDQHRRQELEARNVSHV